MRKWIAITFLLILGLFILKIAGAFPFGRDTWKVARQYVKNVTEEKWWVAEHYVDKGIKENRGSNLVTSIVVNYRGFDTLGEVTVLFLAATALAFLLSSCTCFRKYERIEASLILKTASDTLYPLLILFGAYIFIHGHLTPGGGFQGGTVIASAVMLMLLAHFSFHPNHKVLSVTEGLAGIIFAAIGLAGLIWGRSFLANNILPLGHWNRLFSAGVIPLIYVAIGFKVGSELSGLITDMFKVTKEE